MDGGRFLHTPIRVRAVVDPAGQALFFKGPVDVAGPFLPPVPERLFLAPIGGGDGVEHGIPGLVQNPVAVPVQRIDAVLLRAPFAALVDGPDRAEDVKVRIGDAAALRLRGVNGEVHDHALTDKLLRQEATGQGDVFLDAQFVLQGDVVAVGKLGLRVFLRPLHGVPKRLPVCKFLRRMGWQQDFGTDHAALAGVIHVAAVVITVQLFPGAVGRGGNSRLPRGAADQVCVEVVEGHSLTGSFGRDRRKD